MKVVRRLCAVLTGLVFFVAGILKLMDPVGAGLAVDAQLKFLHLGFLCPLSPALGEIFAFADAVLGAALLSGVWKKTVSRVALALLSFYTLLTLILLVFNPDISCGCFGEAFPLSHLQSFLKNIVLLALLFAAFFPFRDVEPTERGKVVGFALVGTSLFFFSLYSLLSLPLVDYTNLAPGMEFAQTEEEELEVKADGDAVWAELSFTDASGGYADSLLTSGNVVVVSVSRPSALSARAWKRISRISDAAARSGALPIVLLSCAPEDLVYYPMDQKLLSGVYFADRKSLLTLNRSNGGSTLICDGQIVKKWPSYATPSADDLSAGCNATEMMIASVHRGSIFLQAFIFYGAALLLLL